MGNTIVEKGLLYVLWKKECASFYIALCGGHLFLNDGKVDYRKMSATLSFVVIIIYIAHKTIMDTSFNFNNPSNKNQHLVLGSNFDADTNQPAQSASSFSTGNFKGAQTLRIPPLLGCARGGNNTMQNGESIMLNEVVSTSFCDNV